MNVRVLRPEEHDRLIGLGVFERVTTGPNPDTSNVVVAEDENGQIVGYWCMFNAVHLEPLWVDPTHRKSGIGRRMWDGVLRVLENYGITHAFAMVDEEINVELAESIGFQRAGAQTMMIDLGEAKKLVGVEEG